MRRLSIAAMRKLYSSLYAKCVHQFTKNKLAKSRNNNPRPVSGPEPEPKTELEPKRKRKRIRIRIRIRRSKRRDWSQLPNDTLGLISEFICSYKDQMSFRGVCKSWRLVSQETRTDYKLPWLLLLKDKKFSPDPNHHLLYNPWGKEEYVFECQTRDEDNHLVTRHVMASNSGWVLIRLGGNWAQLVMFSPFSHEIVSLPRLIGMYFWFPFTFTYCPRTRSFAVYGALSLEAKFDPRAILVISWRSGDEDWTYHDFTLDPLFRDEDFDSLFINRLHFFQGHLYCFFGPSGFVGKFDFSSDDKYWRIVAGRAKEITDPQHPPEYVVCEFKGEIYIVFRYDTRVEIFRLDLGKQMWVEEVNLGERVVFFCPEGGFSSMISVGERFNFKEMAGRVYCREDESAGHYRVDIGRDADSTYVFQWPTDHLTLTGASRLNTAVWLQLPN